MGYKSYSEYSSSEVDWLGDLPEHWKVSRLKWSVRGCINGVWGDEPNGLDDVVCIRVADFNRDNFTVSSDVLTLRSVDKSQLVARSLQKGDLLIEKSGGGEKQLVGCVVYFDHDFDAVSSNFVARMPVEEAQNPRFWCYQHASLYAAKVNFLAIKQTTGIQNLDSSYYLSLLAAYPPPSEQKHIADFLDWKTGQIDALIAKKRQLIEKLQEQRSAVITRAVTKGLNPDAPMKDSGIPWLSQVPEHWEVRRLKFIFPTLSSGVSVNSDNTPSSDGSTAILKTSSVYGNRFKPEENKRVVEDEIDRVACEVTKDSLIISRMNTPELVGNCGYVDKDYANLYLPDRLWIARFSEQPKSCGKFAWYLVTSHPIASLTGILATGTSGSMKNLTQEAFLDMFVGVPPLEEQVEIASNLDCKTAKLDALEEKTSEAIDRLTEYRTALITAATTGKIDVRNVAIPTSPTEQLNLAFAEDEEHRA